MERTHGGRTHIQSRWPPPLLRSPRRCGSFPSEPRCPGIRRLAPDRGRRSLLLATAPTAAVAGGLSAGFEHTCGVRTNGTVFCWGRNTERQSNPPAGIFSAVTAGDLHACGVKPDGTIACWGGNGAGEATAPGGTFTAVSAGTPRTTAG